MLLETVQTSLLLLFADGVHALLEVCSGDLGITTLLSLFFDLEHAPSVLLVHAAVLFSLFGVLQFQFKVRGTPSPGINFSLHLVTLSLQVCQGFFKSLGKLLLGVQMLFDGTDTSFLILVNLRDSEVFAAGTVSKSRRWRNGNRGGMNSR